MLRRGVDVLVCFGGGHRECRVYLSFLRPWWTEEHGGHDAASKWLARHSVDVVERHPLGRASRATYSPSSRFWTRRHCRSVASCRLVFEGVLDGMVATHPHA